MGDLAEPDRGPSSSHMRTFRCKDCQREHDSLVRQRKRLRQRRRSPEKVEELSEQIRAVRARAAVYNEQWAKGLIERGGSRSDRCKEHREQHRNHIQGMAVAYIDLRTVGEVRDRKNPTGPLGGLGPLPDKHEIVPNTSYSLQDVNVGMTDAHVVEMVGLLREKRVLILKAGTGTGKSTFAPYRLLDPPPESLVDVPPGSPFAMLSELGQIVVTEPRVQATVGVAEFVGGVMSGAGGVGPGFPVGYQVSGDRNHDEACQLVYVTDGTMINWLREGRLSRIGTVIVDEAHERSTNIDFILGYLKRELDRYPHLRVIVTSATFNTKFYQEYFGGPDVANIMNVDATKSFGYGMPLFPNLDVPEHGEDDVLVRWDHPDLPLAAATHDDQAFIEMHWPEQFAPPLVSGDVADDNADDEGYEEDVWDTTRALLDLRYQGSVPIEQWREQMPDELAKFVIQLARGLDEAGIYGDILGFLPTTRTIEAACDQIQLALGHQYRNQIFPLISTLPKDRQLKALARRRKGDRRKIVISTNLAETSLTVEGVRFVVDSGLIAQSEWDPNLAKGGIFTKTHSRAGIKQRWGRVGRKGPGWVFPLYSKGQYLSLAEDTPPGSTRENLEALVMTAKLGGIDDVVGFPWPAAFQPTTVELDEIALGARRTFGLELVRADRALQAAGAVDHEGHPTPFGKELARFQGLGSAASALAILYADKLACVPEVVAILSLLEDTRLIGDRGLLLDDFAWPDEWRLEAAERHRGLATLCEDDAHLVLLVVAAWERADPNVAPWEPSAKRRDWARRWWVSNDILLESAGKQRDVLAALSPAMKEEVRRFIEPALLDRARGVITRAFAPHIYRRIDDVSFACATAVAAGGTDDEPADADLGDGADSGDQEVVVRDVIAGLEDDAVVRRGADAVIALRRREAKDDNRISNLVAVQPWAQPPSADGVDAVPAGDREAMRLVVAAACYAAPDPDRDVALHFLESWPVGQRMLLNTKSGGQAHVDEVLETIEPFARPKTEAELDRKSPARGKSPRRARKGYRRPVDGDEQDATRDDSNYDLNPHRGRKGYHDEDEIAASEFQRVDSEAESVRSCGYCDACSSGREDGCENASAVPEDSQGENALDEWLCRARTGVDVSKPVVLIEGEGVDGEAWYEVVGYSDDAGNPGVVLRRDWRPDGFTGTPAEHVGVQAGDPVEVTVGPMTRHHGGELRIFNRVDGQGRFVMKEASSADGRKQEQRGELAVSLHRGARGLLAELVEGEKLTATVVPARVKGCYSITLLELLHQHLKKAAGGRGVEFRMLDTTNRNASQSRLYPAVVESVPNERGYASFTLLLQDVSRGIRHRFDLRVGSDATSADDGADGSVTWLDAGAAADPLSVTRESDGAIVAPFEVGTPVLLNLVRDYAQLPVGGLDLDVLEEIESESNRQLRLFGGPGSDRGRSGDRSQGRLRVEQTADSVDVGHDPDGEEDDHDDEPIRAAGPDVVLTSMSEEPLSRSAARKLSALDDSAEWQNDVWAFWARSHHLRTDRKTPWLPGTSTEVIDVRSKVAILEASPQEEKRKRVAAFAAEHPVGSVVSGMVEQATERGVEIRLVDGVEGWVRIAELSWTYTEHASDDVKPGEPIRALVLAIDTDKPKIDLSVKALLPKPFDVFKASHRVGQDVRGVVRNATDTHVYVELPGDVNGVVFVGDLTHVRVASAAAEVGVGQELRARIKNFDDRRSTVELSVKALLPKPYDVFKASHRVGQDVRGVVRNATDTHVYVELPGDVNGVVFVGDLTHVRVASAAAEVGVGQELRARIKNFDDRRSTVELSVKALLPKPYDVFKASHRVGQDVRGVVRNATDTHVYVELPGDVNGVVFVGDLTHVRVASAAAEVRVGQELRARIKNFDDRRSTVELSVKALLPKPYDVFKASHRVGQDVRGVVRNATDTHVYVELPGDVNGVVFVGDLTHVRVASAAAEVRVGQELRARIKNFDDRRSTVELSVKALLPKPYDVFKASHRVGQLVNCAVTVLHDSFAFVELSGGAQGSIHISQLATYRVNHPSAVVQVGSHLGAKILSFDDQRGKVQLSLRP